MPNDVYVKINSANPIRLGSAVTNALFPTAAESGVYHGNSYTVPDLDGFAELDSRFIENYANLAASGNAIKGTNVDVIQTFLAAGPGRSHAIDGITASYSATPTSGRLTVEDAIGVIVYDVDIAAAGPFNTDWDKPLTGSGNVDMRIKLQAGGPNVVGKLNIKEHYIL